VKLQTEIVSSRPTMKLLLCWTAVLLCCCWSEAEVPEVPPELRPLLAHRLAERFGLPDQQAGDYDYPAVGKFRRETSQL